MALATTITLTHADINTGDAVNLNNATLTYQWKNLTSVDAVPDKYDIVEADFRGWENPKMTITGAVDVDQTTLNCITMELLQEFAKIPSTSTTPITLVCQLGSLTGIQARGNLLDSSGSITGISVMVETFSLIPAGVGGHHWTYSLTLTEVKA